jgi:hypothetical protein
MEEDLTSDERKQISKVFKRESRSLKRSEKQAVAKAIRDLGLF